MDAARREVPAEHAVAVLDVVVNLDVELAIPPRLVPLAIGDAAVGVRVDHPQEAHRRLGAVFTYKEGDDLIG